MGCISGCGFLKLAEAMGRRVQQVPAAVGVGEWGAGLVLDEVEVDCTAGYEHSVCCSLMRCTVHPLGQGVAAAGVRGTLALCLAAK